MCEFLQFYLKVTRLDTIIYRLKCILDKWIESIIVIADKLNMSSRGITRPPFKRRQTFLLQSIIFFPLPSSFLSSPFPFSPFPIPPFPLPQWAVVDYVSTT